MNKATRQISKKIAKKYPLPSNLESQAWMHLHTRLATHIYHGSRENNTSIGVPRFIFLIKPIFTESENDNPYADWFLIQQEKKLNKAIQTLEVWTNQHINVLRSYEGMEFNLCHSANVVKLPLKFSVPAYGAKAGLLIKAYDDLVRALETGRHYGVVFQQSYGETLMMARRVIAKALGWVCNWPKISVTRKDINNDNAKAQSAYRAMKHLINHLDEKILSGDLRPRHVIRSINATDSSVVS